MKTLTIIPARAGSQRIPGKNWRPLGGRPLADFAMSAVAKAASCVDVLVSTDSPQVYDLAGRYPSFFRVRRPEELCTDTALAIDYVHHALSHMAGLGRAGYEAVTIVQVTSPFTRAADIDGTVSLLELPDTDSAVSVMRVPHDLHPLKFKTLAAGKMLRPYFEEERGRMAEHQLPKAYVRNGSVYVTKLAAIAAGEIIGRRCRGYLMPRGRSLDLNDEFDWAMAEFMLSSSKHLE